MNKKYFWGIIFILIGVIGILNEFFNINLFYTASIWPLFILLPGIYFHYEYFFKRKLSGILVPGGILITIGILFVFETITNWRFSGYTWPIYILAPAIGLFEFYIFGGRDKGLLIPIVVLTTIALISFASMSFGNIIMIFNSSIIFPSILLVIGIYIIFKKGK